MAGDAHWKIGEVTVVSVIERQTEMPLEFIPSATEQSMQQHGEWLTPWALTDDGTQLRFVIQALCLTVGDQKIVVDTCVGPRQLPEVYAWVANDGSFIDVLSEAGFGRDDVDIVVCTHLHFDHVGWFTIRENGAWVPTFRNARYLVTGPENDAWERASTADKEAQNVFNLDDALSPLFEAGVVDLVGVDHPINSALSLTPTPGHSPGHVSVRIESGGERALITGDCAHHPIQLVEPEWCSVADGNPAVANETRRAVVAEYADTGTLIIGTHFPPPGAGHLVTEDGAVRFRPLSSGG